MLSAYSRTILCVFVLIDLLTSEVSGWSSGAPPSTCKSLYPVHGVAQQRDPCPYFISLDRRTIRSNESVTVTIGGHWFKGFVLMAKPTGSWQQRWQDSIGRFQNTFGLNVFDCGELTGNAVSHSNSQYNDDVEVIWRPPPGFEGRVTFLATILKTYKVFWTFVHSLPVRVSNQ